MSSPTERRLLALTLTGYTDTARPLYRVVDLGGSSCSSANLAASPHDDSGDHLLADDTPSPAREAALELQRRGYPEGTMMAFFSCNRTPLWMVRLGAVAGKERPVDELTIREALEVVLPVAPWPPATIATTTTSDHQAADEAADRGRRPQHKDYHHG